MSRSPLLLPLFAVAVMLNACGGKPAITPYPSPPPLPSGSLIPAPAPSEAVHPDPNYDYGYVIQITPSGIHPHVLLSGCCLPVKWENLTSTTVSVVFTYVGGDSGPIPPGGTWTFTPPATESIAYHLGEGLSMQGVLLVQSSQGK